MSITEFRWPRRRPVVDEQEPRTFRVRDLDEGIVAAYPMPDYTGTQRPRTAQTIAAEIEHLRAELANARALVAQGEAKEAELTAELKVKIDEEIAAKKAAHDAEVAELEGLRPATGGSDEGNQA